MKTIPVEIHENLDPTESKPTANAMLALMKKIECEEPPDPGDNMRQTHVFIAHPARHYDLGRETQLDRSGIYVVALRIEYIHGLEVQGHFAEIPVLVSLNAPIHQVHLLRRADIIASLKRGLKL